MEKTDIMSKENYSFEDLLEIMKILRSEEGCPWDREQTHKTIRKNLIEETYEVIEGIDKEDDDILIEELGDLLLQVVFHCRIAEEEKSFSIAEVTDAVCKKLIRRHPHIFAVAAADNADAAVDNWENIKKNEKGVETFTEQMQRICSMPALMRAQKVVGKAAKSGFDWDSIDGALQKVEEERAEFTEAVKEGNKEAAFEEAGDMLFATVVAIRKSGIESEEALTFATDKFISRYSHVESLVKEQGKDMAQLSEEELVAFWKEAKKI